MPAVSCSVRRKLDKIKMPERLVIFLRDTLPPFKKGFRLFQLAAPDCGKYVRQVEFVSGRDNIVLPAGARRCIAVPRRSVHSVEAHCFHPLRKIFVTRTDHSAFRRGDIFCDIERENAGIGNCSCIAERCGRRKRMRRVFNDLYVVYSCKRAQFFHIADISGDMHRNNGFYPRIF